jgi:hypothetical protein
MELEGIILLCVTCCLSGFGIGLVAAGEKGYARGFEKGFEKAKRLNTIVDYDDEYITLTYHDGTKHKIKV